MTLSRDTTLAAIDDRTGAGMGVPETEALCYSVLSKDFCRLYYSGGCAIC